jgi:simple sugar transport system substrate-binding protein
MIKRIMVGSALVALCLSLAFAAISYGFEPVKIGEGMTIRFLAGGPPGGPFATVVVNGALQAAHDLGCEVEVIWSDWSVQDMIIDFKEAVAANPDGIVVYGYAGEDAGGPIIDDAVSKGITVTSINTNFPTYEKKYGAEGHGWVGAEVYSVGVKLTEYCIRELGLGEGDRALVYGLLKLGVPGRGERTVACTETLEQAGVTVDYIEISDAVNADPTMGIPVVSAYIASHPDVDLIITDHGGLTATLPTYLKAAGAKPGEIAGAGFDPTPAAAEGIREGYILAVWDQQQFLHGYLSVLQICLTRKFKFSGLHIDTGSGVVNASNVEALAALADAGIR